MSNNAVLPMLDGGWDVRLVNPNRDTVYGHRPEPHGAGRPRRRGALAGQRRAFDRRGRRGRRPRLRWRGRGRRGVRRAGRRRCRPAGPPGGGGRPGAGRRRAELQRVHERAQPGQPLHRREDLAAIWWRGGGVAERVPPALVPGCRATAPTRLRGGGVVGQRGGVRPGRLRGALRRRSRHHGDLPGHREDPRRRALLRRGGPGPCGREGRAGGEARAHRALPLHHALAHRRHRR